MFCHLLLGDFVQAFIRLVSSVWYVTRCFCSWQNVFSESEMEGWRRHWCVLNSDQISLWDHPVAEIYKVPLLC